MLDASVLSALKVQIGIELRNAVLYLYLQAASWLRANGWRGFAERMRKASSDEFEHAQAWVEYLSRRGQAWTEPTIATMEGSPDESPMGFAERALDLEESTEEAMRNLVRLAASAGEGGLEQFTGSRLETQEIETQDARDFAARIADAEKQSGALALLDRDCGRQGEF